MDSGYFGRKERWRVVLAKERSARGGANRLGKSGGPEMLAAGNETFLWQFTKR